MERSNEVIQMSYSPEDGKNDQLITEDSTTAS
jgi:hypothetical protein